MGCSSGGACSSGGCSSGGGCSGACSSGGCNKLNTYDWLSANNISDPRGYEFVEVSFKNGARKEFFRIKPNSFYETEDWVVVDTGGGYDIGQVSLSGELVLLQLKKKRIKESFITCDVIRLANERDLERFREARNMEHESMVKARAAARSLGLDMKVGDVEYQCDLRKATFYFTSDTRVDFRELIRIYAKEFRVKIEMRQIGARQESAKIGGIGTCGRELCCSTWLTSFKSVNTSAARYQNLSINQAKLSGQCGRLKCCLNYELDTYLEALEHFPDNADTLKLKKGRAFLIKTDIFKGIMFYSYEEDGRNVVVGLNKDTVFEIQNAISKGNYPDSLMQMKHVDVSEVEEEFGYDDDGTGEIELPSERRRKKKKKPLSSRGGEQGQNSKKTKQENTHNQGGTSEKREDQVKKQANKQERQGDGVPKQNKGNRRNDRSRNVNKEAGLPAAKKEEQGNVQQKNTTTQEDKNINRTGTGKRRNNRKRPGNRKPGNRANSDNSEHSKPDKPLDN